MRMSNHVGMYTQNNELTFYDYLLLDGQGSDLNTFLWIDTPVYTPNAKIVMRIKPISGRSSIYALGKFGVAETNYRRGLEVVRDFNSRLKFGALDGPYVSKTVGDFLDIGSWYDVIFESDEQDVYITVGETRYQVEGLVQEFSDGGASWQIFGHLNRILTGNAAIGITDFYDLNDNLLAHMIPCVKRPGKYIGAYDTVNEAFYAAFINGEMQTTKSTFLSVGNLT